MLTHKWRDVRAKRVAEAPPKLPPVDILPDELLIYALLNRGSVLPTTFRQIIDQIQHGEVHGTNAMYLDQARELARALWSPGSCGP